MLTSKKLRQSCEISVTAATLKVFPTAGQNNSHLTFLPIAIRRLSGVGKLSTHERALAMIEQKVEGQELKAVAPAPRRAGLSPIYSRR